MNLYVNECEQRMIERNGARTGVSFYKTVALNRTRFRLLLETEKYASALFRTTTRRLSSDASRL